VRPRQGRVLAQACGLQLELLDAQERQVAADLRTTAAVTKSSWAIIQQLAARAEAPRRRACRLRSPDLTHDALLAL